MIQLGTNVHAVGTLCQAHRHDAELAAFYMPARTVQKLLDQHSPEQSQSTSSIFEASSGAPSTSSSGGRSSSPRPSSSSSILKPSLIIRWMRPANCVGSSKLKPEVSNEVSKSNQMRSLTVLSDLSAAAFFLSLVRGSNSAFISSIFFFSSSPM